MFCRQKEKTNLHKIIRFLGKEGPLENVYYIVLFCFSLTVIIFYTGKTPKGYPKAYYRKINISANKWINIY